VCKRFLQQARGGRRRGRPCSAARVSAATDPHQNGPSPPRAPSPAHPRPSLAAPPLHPQGLGLDPSPTKPLVAVITRLVPQKGIHLIRAALYR
jgi:hypothetical protein